MELYALGELTFNLQFTSPEIRSPVRGGLFVEKMFK